ncbi:tripartite tricarboxylate transporter TctB family protein [Limimaricola litoreus]|uniref:Tripartite tricarboxylate transporter TctB family protein n=1 Tax=Limimaricola litoreus TaxID=2955316 RepID=A0A9X2FR62_9RHOB|nr:tripartite tricarboxylate transporter TctB family protein [Limimaricola litoreus]MCP1170347.1 tripartite tricarboxylate transporter TctB family protein [Limimaricola litoreus]
MKLPLFRGALIVGFFALVLFALIPIYVPRPAFIPGFTPPPAWWPRVVSIVGLSLGILSILIALKTRGDAPSDTAPIELTAPIPVLVGRFLLAVAAFAGFVFLMPLIGFLASSILLTGVAIALTGDRDRKLWAVLVSIGLPVALVYFFGEALGTGFPKGALIKQFGL